VIVWGGLRGALALALALSLDSTFPERDRVLDLNHNGTCEGHVVLSAI
jgi:NhaP-type Na+/H+ or K+/H+ antiporter